ncbi:hypothetical protein K491DRAFT_574418, partial [Lophiostoma macrostomum CBS 122681]
FRRFKTTHLLNLRYLENEIVGMDHTIYQAGLSLSLSPSSEDRLGLGHARKDKTFETLVPTALRLMQLPDEALISFNQLMAMETFSLLDDEKQASLQSHLSLHEIYKTRLLRADLGPRSRTDPFQRWLHKCLRAFRYWRLSKRSNDSGEGSASFDKNRGARRSSYQNTVLIAEASARVAIAVLIGIFLVVPLYILSHHDSKNFQLVVVSVWILVLSFLVALLLKVTSFELMAISAAYAAVLSVFVSNVPASS